MESRPSNAPSYETGISVSSLEFGQTLMKGPLLRKDRLKWTKCHCLIRNSFFECHKNSDVSSKPLLKLLLVGSQVTSNQVSILLYTFVYLCILMYCMVHLFCTCVCNLWRIRVFLLKIVLLYMYSL